MSDEPQVQALSVQAEALSVEIQRLGDGRLIAVIRNLLALAGKINTEKLADLVEAITRVVANPADIAAWLELFKLAAGLIGGGDAPAAG